MHGSSNNTQKGEKESAMSSQTRRAPHNTGKEAREHPIIPLAEAMRAAAGTGNATNAILMQESAGQRSFVNSETLPSRTNDYESDSKGVLAKAGVKFGEVVERDPLFQYVELPEGWKKVGTGHSM